MVEDHQHVGLVVQRGQNFGEALVAGIGGEVLEASAIHSVARALGRL